MSRSFRLTKVWLLSVSLAASAASASNLQTRWIPTLQEAMKIAREEAKLIVLDVSAEWCPPCQEMARTVYPDPQFIEFSRTQVFMLVDADKHAEGVRLKGLYRVDAFPTILVLDQDGNEIDRMTGGRDTETLIQDLTRILDDPIPYKKLNQAAEEAPDDFGLQLRAGRRAHQRQDYKRAKSFLDRALALHSGEDVLESTELLITHMRACFESGQYEDCLRSILSLEKLASQFTSDLQLQMYKARALTSLGRHEESAALINNLLKGAARKERDQLRDVMGRLPKKYRQDDERFLKLIESAQKSLSKGRFEEASQQLAEAAELDSSPDLHRLQAELDFRRAEQSSDPAESSRLRSQGLRSLRLSRRLDPHDMITYSLARGFLASQHNKLAPEAPEAKKKYDKAESKFAAKRLREAGELYMEVIKLEPAFALAYLHLGDCFFENNQFNEALQLYQEAVRRAPLTPSTYRFAASALRKLQRMDEAGRYLRMSLMADPEYPLVWADLEAEASAERKGFERHWEVVPTRLLLASPDDDYEGLFDDLPPGTEPAWREYLNHKLLWQREKYAQEFPQGPFYAPTAREEIESLTQLAERWDAMRRDDPELGNPELDFIRQLSIDGQLPAFVYLELYTEEYRGEFEAWKAANSAAIEEYLENYVFLSALAQLRQGINSSAVEAYNAGVRLHQSDRAKAIEHYERAVRQDPGMINAWTNLNLLYGQMGQNEKAEEALNAWIAVDPENYRPYEMLSIVYAKNNQYEKAIELASKALTLKMPEDERSRVQRNLEIFRKNLQRR